MSALRIQYGQAGVFLPGLGLWLDSRRRQAGPDRVFVSHAHADHIGAHREVILTEATGSLMRARLGGSRLEHRLSFEQPAQFQAGAIPFQITLLPAGHIFGSAMSFIEAEGESLLYTGDFKLRPNLSCDPCRPRRADILIMETTFGRPRFRFPPAAEVWRSVKAFCHETLALGQTPVLLAYSLGKSQETLRALADTGLPLMLHSPIDKLTRIYEAFGQTFPPYERFAPSAVGGKILIWPPNARNSPQFLALGPAKTAILTGWAVEPGCRFRYHTDAAFPISDHADYDELLEMVRQVAPRKIHTLHGFAWDFADTLRQLGFDAHALGEPDQLSLPLVG